jgi:hypothetical protein
MEIIACFGTDPMNCREFEAEIEWRRGEARKLRIISVPTAVAMPKDLYHGPIEIRKIKKPFVFLEVMRTSR